MKGSDCALVMPELSALELYNRIERREVKDKFNQQTMKQLQSTDVP